MSNEAVPVYLSLGSNVGNRRENLDNRLEFLSERMRVDKTSSVYEPPPENNPDQPRFSTGRSCPYMLEPQAAGIDRG
jgi:7,8-dihydro-6-hydroxymethylpterin-pyrophosphokinase